MGKGIAYQFKRQFPHNFDVYHHACKSGELRPGKLVWCRERGKIIINFPTKDKWRNGSKMEYIEDGLDALIQLVGELRIRSIAIPPLGSGNGGLVWPQVRQLLEQRLRCLESSVQIIIFEPSKAYSAQPAQEPKLGVSALVLMDIKRQLSGFSMLRLQKAAYFTGIFNRGHAFQFVKHTCGPYADSIERISRDIKAYQEFHHLKSTEQARDILYQKIVSRSVDQKLTRLAPAIQSACRLVNGIPDDRALACLAAVCFIIETHQGACEQTMMQAFLAWPRDQASPFDKTEIRAAIDRLYEEEMIERNLEGFVLSAPMR